MVIRTLICVGGPLDGHTIQVADVEHLPRQLTFPYAEADQADKAAYYRPTRVVLFRRAMWVLVHAPIHPDSHESLALALLNPAAYKAWSVAPATTQEGSTP